MVKITSSEEKENNENTNESDEAKNESNEGGLGCLVTIAVILLIIWGVVSWQTPEQAPLDNGNTQQQNAVDKVDAQAMGRVLLEKRLKAPSTTDYPLIDIDKTVEELKNDKFRYHSYVNSENSFGAKIKTNFDMTLEYKGNGEWELMSIETW